jgi:hypothetical protein
MLYRPFRARNHLLQVPGVARKAAHPWLTCGRSVGALLSGPCPDELIVPLGLSRTVKTLDSGFDAHFKIYRVGDETELVCPVV